MRYAVIMAGGKGTRLWPAARQSSPKQLQRLIFEEPLIAETVNRLAKVYSSENILIVTGQEYAGAIADILPDLPVDNIIAEPFGRNTAAAIALAAFRIAQEDRDAVFGVFPADHVILKPEALYCAIEYGQRLAMNHRVVDIGVPPMHPETGYGYIELGESIGEQEGLQAYRVSRFVEKPNRETAEQYVQAGNYIWNSGMFIWRAQSFLDALQEFLPETYARLASVFDHSKEAGIEDAYARIPDISVDYGIMERVSDVVAIPVDFGWRDIGDWAALYDMMRHDLQGNAGQGNYVSIDTHNSMLFAPNKLIATIGLEDMVVVDTPDVLLVLPRSRSQEVKQLLDKVREVGREDLL